jgi:hypothetical protein
VDVQPVLGDGQHTQLDQQASPVEEEEERVFAAHRRLGPVTEGPMPVHEVGRRGRDYGREDGRLQLPVCENGQHQSVEQCVVDDGVDTAHRAKLQRLFEKLLPTLR